MNFAANDSAKTYFEKSSDTGSENDYLVLIKAHLHPDDVSIDTLCDLISFEDTKQLLLSEKYICSFLLGS
jgi:hypothetical protein